MIKKILLIVLLTASLPSLAIEHTVHDELMDKNNLYEVVRHLYRWYMDEEDVNNTVESEEFVFLVRMLEADLDENDRSLFAEVILPVPGITVRLKKPDYDISELDITIKGDRFKITNVARGVPDDSRGARRIVVDYEEMRGKLFRTRNDAQFPSDDMLTMLRSTVRKKIIEDSDGNVETEHSGDQVIHIAPISPVANELWIFWETGRLLIHFSSDTDLVNPLVWEYEDLAVKLYDIDEQVVVSLVEVPGSSAYLTRDQVGRALYNCIILGRTLTLQKLNQEPAESDSPEK